MTFGRWVVLGVLLVTAGTGCGTAPRSFLGVYNPSPIVRARAIGLGAGLPDDVVIPTLIERLEDTDPVVRMTANEELKRATRQDFGFVPWADLAERGQAVARWRLWWDQQHAGRARSRKPG